jgi:hypothetical protein
MDWIKRNLYFVVGSVVALVLMGLGGWFLYSKYALNNENMGKLNADYTELARLNGQKPHPGSGEVDNIKAAKEQQQQFKSLMQTCRKHFQRIPPIPEVAKVTDADFSRALSRTIDQLQRDATNASVFLPSGYSFSFEAQKSKMQFASGSLGPLSEQLGEVKAICDLLFQARINSLDSIRRDRVSVEDNNGPQTDYVSEKSTTNELAVLTPYELTFRCFSTELGSVLAGFAASPFAILVKTMNVEPGPALGTMDATGAGSLAYGPSPVNPMMARAVNAENPQAAAAYARRYGVGGGGGGGEGVAASRYGGEGRGGPASMGGVPLRDLSQPAPPPIYAPQPGFAPPPVSAASRGGLPTVLDEKQLKVTMAIYLVKLLPGK